MRPHSTPPRVKLSGRSAGVEAACAGTTNINDTVAPMKTATLRRCAMASSLAGIRRLPLCFPDSGRSHGQEERIMSRRADGGGAGPPGRGDPVAGRGGPTVIGLEDIRGAAERLQGVAVRTPLVRSPDLDE